MHPEAESSDKKWLVSHFTSLPLRNRQEAAYNLLWILWSTYPPPVVYISVASSHQDFISSYFHVCKTLDACPTGTDL